MRWATGVLQSITAQLWSTTVPWRAPRQRRPEPQQRHAADDPAGCDGVGRLQTDHGGPTDRRRREAFIDTASGTVSATRLCVHCPATAPSTATRNRLCRRPAARHQSRCTGNHTIYVHGKDAAGNWGTTSTTTLLIDKTAPTFTGISLAPNPTLGAATVTLTVNGATDTGGAGVAGGEYWINPPTTTAPAPGGGTQFSGLTANIPAARSRPAHTR